MATTPEAAVKKKIRGYLASIGACFFNPIGGPYSAHGVSDIIACWRGRFIAIEVKAPGKVGATTANQLDFLARVAAAGGTAFVADDVETVRGVLEPGTHPNKSVREIA